LPGKEIIQILKSFKYDLILKEQPYTPVNFFLTVTTNFMSC